MLSKHQRAYNPSETSAAKRLRLNVSDLFQSNTVTGKRTQELLNDAAVAGVDDCEPWKKTSVISNEHMQNPTAAHSLENSGERNMESFSSFWTDASLGPMQLYSHNPLLLVFASERNSISAGRPAKEAYRASVMTLLLKTST